MSQCAQCQAPIEEGAKILEVPCCGLKYHAPCGIQELAQRAHIYNTVVCLCGETLYHCPDHGTNSLASEARVEAVKAKPEVPAEVRAIKAKRVLEKKSFGVYTKYVNQKYRDFLEANEAEISALKEIKRAALAEIRASEEYKTYSRTKGAAKRAETVFETKHELGHYESRKILGRQTYRRWSGEFYRVRRKFIKGL
jgi:hypothetical protein